MSSSIRSVYSYSPEGCDVCSQDDLRKFREKRDEWSVWLWQDEHHAISNQITSMLWSDAVFRLINASRKHSDQAAGPYATQNSIVASAIDHGYIAEQLISLRKLMEKASSRPQQQVISLRRLIDDVRGNRHLLTRELFVCHDGLPFDDRGGLDDLPPPDESGVAFAGVPTRGPHAFGMSRHMHEAFDKMMNCSPTDRRRDDKIGDDFFDQIEKTLVAAPYEKLRRTANKMLLHAADEFSRGKTMKFETTLKDVWACHRAILAVANRISTTIGETNIGGVPTPQYDILNNWDSPFAPKAVFDSMLEEWKKENDFRDQWCQELIPPH